LVCARRSQLLCGINLQTIVDRNFGFPSAIFSVFGADFVFASGTIFIARIVEPHEQSLAGGVFNTMLQVRLVQV